MEVSYGLEQRRVGEGAHSLRGHEAALSASCSPFSLHSPRLHTVSWSQARMRLRAIAQLQSRSPRADQKLQGALWGWGAGLTPLWSSGHGGGRHSVCVLSTSKSEGIWANAHFPSLVPHP